MADEQIPSEFDLQLPSLGLSSQESFSGAWDEVLMKSFTNFECNDDDQDRLEISMDKYTLIGSENTVANLGQVLQQQHDHTNLINLPNSQNSHTFSVPDSTQAFIPSNKNWTGEYDFNISFQDHSEKGKKRNTWTYSESLDKLFVNIGINCMVGFKVSCMPPSGCTIRALPVFDKSEHIIEIVKRCPTHSILTHPTNIDHNAPEHLVRCDNGGAVYVEDTNGRQSVVVPFEGPQAGADSSQYLYRFMCLGSCVGGPNRRPIVLIFTLEKDGQVLGRRALRVRICASPDRDREIEERDASKKGKKKVPQSRSTTTEIITIEPQRKRQKFDDEVFTINIRGRANYEILMKLKQALELSALVPDELAGEYYNSQQQLELTPPSTNRSLLPSSLSTSSGCRPSTSHETANLKPQLQKVESLSEAACPKREEGIADHIQLVIDPPVKKDPDESVTSWLTTVGMAGYVDMFLKQGLQSMSQLENFTEQDLSNLRIGEAHQAAIWKSLQERFGMCSALSRQPSTCSNASQTSSAISGQPSIIQVSRYHFKRVTSLKRSNDHNYT